MLERGVDDSMTQPNVRVRLRMEPDQIGITTGKCRDCDGELLVQVRYPGKQPRFEAASDLEPADAVLTVEDVIESGRFERTSTLRKHLTAVQLQGRISDLIYSLNITNTDFMPHQFKPLLALLDSPSRGLLVADEVGLGKTIEAGLIWTELRFRTQATRLLVVCPAMLVEKWKSELSRRFGARPQIVEAGALVSLLDEGLDPSRDTVLICSLQGLRPPRGWDDDDKPADGPAALLARRLQEHTDQTLFDLTVIDEAHYLRNEETASAKLGQLLRPVSEHLLLLSATPINLRSADLFNLLRLVDPDKFSNSRIFEQVLGANLPLVRTASHLKRERATPASVSEHLADAGTHWLLRNSEGLRLLQEELGAMPANTPIAPDRRVELLHRLERVNLLGNAIVRSRKREVFERRVERNASRWAASMTDAENALYTMVSEAIRSYAMGHAGVEGFLLAMPQRQMSSSMYAAASQWLGRMPSSDESQELLYESMGNELSLDLRPVANHVARHIAGRVDLDELRLQDSKFELLKQLVLSHQRDYPTEKVLVFSYFRPTLDYLQQRLAEIGVQAMVVKGGDDKQALIDEFRESLEHQVLLSSEVASEGVDLQFMRVVVNYDLPWNPMKVEQRIGRVDRIGQQSDTISILNLVYADTIDDRILTRLYERLRLFEDALGCTEEVLGDSIATLNRELLSRTLTPDQELARIDHACAAIERRKREMQEVMDHEADLMGLGDYVRANIENAHNNQRRISDRDLLQLLRDYLDLEAPGYCSAWTRPTRPKDGCACRQMP